MSDSPTVYILHGDDELGLKAFVASMREKLGDPSTADLNTTRMEDTLDLAALRSAVRAVPFLAPRRLVILSGVLGSLKSQKPRQDLKDILDDIHANTALVILENEPLNSNHWLLNWANKKGDAVYEKRMDLPKGGALVRWIRDRAGALGGEITHEAAYHLVQMIGDDNRSAENELKKLLAYANYNRPVDIDDVELLVAPVEEGDIFAMVDAIGAKNARTALTMLHRLLSDRDALSLLGMIIRQFRLLIQYKALAQASQSRSEIAKRLKLHEFVAGKLAVQARNYDMPALEAVYGRLVAADEGIKTGKLTPETALDTLIIELAG